MRPLASRGTNPRRKRSATTESTLTNLTVTEPDLGVSAFVFAPSKVPVCYVPCVIKDDHPSALLTVRGVTKSFAGVHALRGVDLEVAAGEVHCVLGQNGAGKSTLIKTLAGVHRPDDGDIRWLGESGRASCRERVCPDVENP